MLFFRFMHACVSKTLMGICECTLYTRNTFRELRSLRATAVFYLNAAAQHQQNKVLYTDHRPILEKP